MCDVVQGLEAVWGLGKLVYDLTMQWYKANKSIPCVLEELAGLTKSLEAVIVPLKNNEACEQAIAPMLDLLLTEIQEATRLYNEYVRCLETSVNINAISIAGKLQGSTTKLQSILDVIVKLRSLTEGKPPNMACIILDQVAANFWSTQIGTAEVDVEYSLFCNAFQVHFWESLSASQKRNLNSGVLRRKGDCNKISAFEFQRLATKYQMKGILEILEFCNPFTDEIPDSSCFYLVSKTGEGYLQPYDEGEDVNTPLVVSPKKSTSLQLWKWGERATLCNVKTGLVIDVDPNCDTGDRHKILCTQSSCQVQSQCWTYEEDCTLKQTGDTSQCLEIQKIGQLNVAFLGTCSGDPLNLNSQWIVENLCPKEYPPLILTLEDALGKATFEEMLSYAGTSSTAVNLNPFNELP
ncbi:hypothetical protein Pelo_6389 [Pelomyxa schiedti]|nr:hypothetical protein Pelo_6389 [Pelomyxa schiedti]